MTIKNEFFMIRWFGGVVILRFIQLLNYISFFSYASTMSAFTSQPSLYAINQRKLNEVLYFADRVSRPAKSIQQSRLFLFPFPKPFHQFFMVDKIAIAILFFGFFDEVFIFFR